MRATWANSLKLGPSPTIFLDWVTNVLHMTRAIWISIA